MGELLDDFFKDGKLGKSSYRSNRRGFELTDITMSLLDGLVWMLGVRMPDADATDALGWL